MSGQEIRNYMNDEEFPEVTLVKVSGFEERKQETLAQRGIFYFFSEINTGSARSLCSSLLWAAATLPPSQPLIVLLSTNGGDVDAGLTIYDTIKGVREQGRQVYTVAIGHCFSMGVVVLQAGSLRLITPNTYLMIHEISSWNWGKLSEQGDTIKYLSELQNRIFKILAERSTLTTVSLRRRCHRRNWWISPDEVLKYRLADDILRDWSTLMTSISPSGG